MELNLMNSVIKKYLLHNRTMKFENDEALQQFLEKRRTKNQEKHKQPESLNVKSNLEKQDFQGMQVFRFNFRHNNKQKLLYIHGGYNVLQPSVFHWRFMDKLALNTLHEVIMPIYPKAPIAHVHTTYQAIMDLYDSLLKEVDSKDIVIMGDGTGGSLALSFVQQLLAQNKPTPNKIYLISPLLDAELNNDVITEGMEKRDKLINKEGIKQDLQCWAGDLTLDHPLISPINGDLTQLPPIYMFGSTKEVYYPDMQKLVELLEFNQRAIHFYPYKRMVHDFPLYPIRQSHKAVRQIVASLQD